MFCILIGWSYGRVEIPLTLNSNWNQCGQKRLQIHPPLSLFVLEGFQLSYPVAKKTGKQTSKQKTAVHPKLKIFYCKYSIYKYYSQNKIMKVPSILSQYFTWRTLIWTITKINLYSIRCDIFDKMKTCHNTSIKSFTKSKQTSNIDKAVELAIDGFNMSKFALYICIKVEIV